MGSRHVLAHDYLTIDKVIIEAMIMKKIMP
jgi:uncharacterized protein with HEPN domain